VVWEGWHRKASPYPDQFGILAKTEVITVNWSGLARSLQPEFMRFVGALLLIFVVWLGIRLVIKRTAAAVAQVRLRTWTDRGACVLALILIGGLMWQVIAVVTINRLPRQDVDGSSVYQRMDAITNK
jgi:hypothetical protein